MIKKIKTRNKKRQRQKEEITIIQSVQNRIIEELEDVIQHLTECDGIATVYGAIAVLGPFRCGTCTKIIEDHCNLKKELLLTDEVLKHLSRCKGYVVSDFPMPCEVCEVCESYKN